MEEAKPERVHTGSVVLDIGGTIGALIIYTDGSQAGREIEISPLGQDTNRSHNVVHERLLNGRTIFAAVFPSVEQGRYTVWQTGSIPASEIEIEGGKVAEVDLRA